MNNVKLYELAMEGNTSAFQQLALKAFAEPADTEALLYLAKCYLHGYSVLADTATGETLLASAIELGNEQAQHYAAIKEKNPDKKANALLAAAKMKQPNDFAIRELTILANYFPFNATAMFNLGICYEKGYGVATNKKKAFKWFETAANAANEMAQFKLGLAYEVGEGVTKNIVEASAHYLKAAKYNNRNPLSGSQKAILRLRALANKYPALVACNYGLALIGGYAVAADLKRGLACLETGYKAGDPNATYHYALHYLEGNGVPLDKHYAMDLLYEAIANQSFLNRNAPEIRETLEKIAQKAPADPLVWRYLGFCFLRGYGTEIDLAQAKLHFKTAAKLDDDMAMAILGNLALPDTASAAWWYLQAAMKENHNQENGSNLAILQMQALAELNPPSADILNNLAICHLEGYGTRKNTDEAISLFLKAAKRGDDCALFNLGALYQTGKHVPENLPLSYNWLFQSAKQNTQNPHGSLKAFALLKQSAKLKKPHYAAARYLAECYEHGYATEKNLKNALSYYIVAAQNGCAYSSLKIAEWCMQGICTEQSNENALKWYTQSANQMSATPNLNIDLLTPLEKLVEQQYQALTNKKVALMNVPLAFERLREAHRAIITYHREQLVAKREMLERNQLNKKDYPLLAQLDIHIKQLAQLNHLPQELDKAYLQCKTILATLENDANPSARKISLLVLRSMQFLNDTHQIKDKLLEIRDNHFKQHHWLKKIFGFFWPFKTRHGKLIEKAINKMDGTNSTSIVNTFSQVVAHLSSQSSNRHSSTQTLYDDCQHHLLTTKFNSATSSLVFSAPKGIMRSGSTYAISVTGMGCSAEQLKEKKTVHDEHTDTVLSRPETDVPQPPSYVATPSSFSQQLRPT